VALARLSDPRTVFWCQRATALIRGHDGLHAHDLFGERARRHGLRCLTQHVVDQPQAFARTEPSAAWPLRLGTGRFRRETWVEQPHGGVEMHETGTMLDDLLLQMAHDPAQLGSLPAQCVHDVRLGHCNSPSQNISVQNGSRMTSPVGIRAWWQLLHDTA